MKYKNIVIAFITALAVSVFARTSQLLVMIEPETGFFISDLKGLGITVTVAVIVLAVVCALLSSISHRNPEHPPKVNPFIALSSLALAFAIPAEVFTVIPSFGITAVHILILKIFGIIAAAFFGFYAVFGVFGISLPKFCYIIPTVYMVVKLMFDFLSISSKPLINDNLLYILAECALLMFLLYFSKLCTGTDNEYNFRKIMASGFSSALGCFALSVPQMIYVFFADGSYYHITAKANTSIFLLGVFALVFTLSHFSEKNKNS